MDIASNSLGDSSAAPALARSGHGFQAVILAGGDGSRIYPLAKPVSPKALLPIGNRPMLWYQLKLLEEHGFSEVIVVTQKAFEEKVARFLGEGYQGSLKVEIVRIKIRPKIKTNFFVLSSDVVTDVLLHRMADVHTVNDAMMTMLAASTKTVEKGKSSAASPCAADDPHAEADVIAVDPSSTRVLYLASQSDIDISMSFRRKMLRKFSSLHLSTSLLDAHVYLFSPLVLEIMEENGMQSIKGELVPWLVRNQFRKNALSSVLGESCANEPFSRADSTMSGGGAEPTSPVASDGGMSGEITPRTPREEQDRHNVRHRQHRALLKSTREYDESDLIRCCIVVSGPGEATCIRAHTLQSYVSANRYLLAGKYAKFSPVSHADSADCGDRSVISKEAIVGENFRAGEKCSVKKSTIGANVSVGNAVKILNSIIHDNVVVEDDCVLNNVVICGNAVIRKGSSLKDCQVAFGFEVPAGSDCQNEALTADELENIVI